LAPAAPDPGRYDPSQFRSAAVGSAVVIDAVAMASLINHIVALIATIVVGNIARRRVMVALWSCLRL
jgi:hypothetical protein